jgi:hypothetical protein
MRTGTSCPTPCCSRRRGSRRGRRPGGYTAGDVERWAARRGAKIAVLQYEWDEIAGRIPSRWIRVGTWQLPRNVIFRDNGVGFYAVDSTEAGPLARNLAAYSTRLPRAVRASVLRAAATP